MVAGNSFPHGACANLQPCSSINDAVVAHQLYFIVPEINLYVNHTSTNSKLAMVGPTLPAVWYKWYLKNSGMPESGPVEAD